MRDLFLWALAVLGLIYIVTQSVIGRPIRMWVASKGMAFEVLVYCPACCGFWIGLGLYLLIPSSEIGLLYALAGCGLGALWSEYGPSSVWEMERKHAKEKEADEDST